MLMGRIVVAGGSGFIGRALVRRLVREGVDVAVMTAHPERSAAAVRSLGAEVVRGDIQRDETLRPAVEGAEVVVQSLTFPSFPVEKAAKGWTFEGFEHRGTERLVRASAAAGVKRFVYVSGVGVAPDAAKVWHRAKWHGEQAVLGESIEAVVVRPSWVYGPEDRALNRFVTFARRSPMVPVLGDGEQRINPVFVDDVAEVLAQAAAIGGPTGVFEVGGPEILTMNDVLRTLLQVMGKDKPLVHFPVWMPKSAGFFAQVLPKPPLSPDAIDFAIGDAVADLGPLLEAFDVRLRTLREGLASYLAPAPA
jgi:NADH dehydrogenase